MMTNKQDNTKKQAKYWAERIYPKQVKHIESFISVYKSFSRRPKTIHLTHSIPGVRQALILFDYSSLNSTESKSLINIIVLRELLTGNIDIYTSSITHLPDMNDLNTSAIELLYSTNWHGISTYDFCLNPRGESIGALANHHADAWQQFLAHNGLYISDREIHLAFFKQRKRLGAIHYGAVLSNFNKRLQTSVLKILYRSAYYEATLYNYYNGNGEASLGRIRRQAANSYPLLTRFYTLSELKTARKVSDCIDKQQPLAKAIAEQLKLSPNLVRKLQGLHWQRTGRWILEDLQQNLNYLNQLNHWPCNRSEWKSYSSILPRIKKICALTGKSLPQHLKKFTVNQGTKAEKLFKLLEPGEPLDTLQDPLEDITFSVIRLAASLKSRTTISRSQVQMDMPHSTRLLVQHLVKNLNLNQLARLSTQWHQTHNNIMDSVELQINKTTPLTWLPLISSPYHYDELTIVSLHTALQLKQEGRALEHCVRSYTNKCLCHGSHILAIRNLANEPISTAEISLNNNHKLIIKQHRGRFNSSPSKKEKQAVSQLILDIENNKVTCEKERLLSFQQKNKIDRRYNATDEQELIDQAYDKLLFENFKQFLISKTLNNINHEMLPSELIKLIHCEIEISKSYMKYGYDDYMY